MTIYLIFLLPTPAASTPPPTQSSFATDHRFAFFLVLVFAAILIGFVRICISHFSDDNIPLYSSFSSSVAAAARPGQLSPSGLDQAVIDSFPIFNYSEIKHLKIGKGTLTCAVCVCEFEDSERLRLLPKCDHMFHPECIDPWLASHSTCPICRANLREKIELTQSPELCNSAAEISEAQNHNQIAITVDENQGIDTEASEEVAEAAFNRSLTGSTGGGH